MEVSPPTLSTAKPEKLYFLNKGVYAIIRSMKSEKIRLLLADDHVMLRQGTTLLLQRQPEFEVVGQAENGQQAIDLTRKLKPDIVIMDVRMPVLSGLEATRYICRELPGVQVLVLTAHDDDQYVFSLLEAGASGYLLKSAPIADLIQAIHQVHAGDSPLHPAIARKVVLRLGVDRQQDAAKAKAPGIQPLTTREQEVLQLLAQGSSNQEIAEKLVISNRTVQAHLTNIFAKMQVSSRLQAVLTAIRQGWLSLDF